MRLNCWKFTGGKARSKSKRWRVCAVALLSFTAGSLITARLAHIDQVRADGNRVFELRVYHTLPSKVPALESRFRDHFKAPRQTRSEGRGLLDTWGDTRLG
jgi:hypothetical protein